MAVNLNYAISPLLFGNGVVSMNQSCGVLFGAVLPEDFFEENETVFLKYMNRDLHLLLRMPFNHFMSHILFDDNMKKALSTFFLYAPRVYDPKRKSGAVASPQVPRNAWRPFSRACCASTTAW